MIFKSLSTTFPSSSSSSSSFENYSHIKFIFAQSVYITDEISSENYTVTVASWSMLKKIENGKLGKNFAYNMEIKTRLCSICECVSIE